MIMLRGGMWYRRTQLSLSVYALGSVTQEGFPGIYTQAEPQTSYWSLIQSICQPCKVFPHTWFHNQAVYKAILPLGLLLQ